MDKPEDILKKNGLRITQHRLDIIHYLAKESKPLALNDFHKEFIPKINRITLYRILNDFEEKRMLRIFFSHDGQKMIEWSFTAGHGKNVLHEQHLHFQCKKCEKIYCLDDVKINNLPDGFNVSTQQSVLVGKCSICE
jgi:Fur family ferric uptake transcriptional regulator